MCGATDRATARRWVAQRRESATETYDRMWREYDDKTRFRRTPPRDEDDHS